MMHLATMYDHTDRPYAEWTRAYAIVSEGGEPYQHIPWTLWEMVEDEVMPLVRRVPKGNPRVIVRTTNESFGEHCEMLPEFCLPSVLPGMVRETQWGRIVQVIPVKE